MVPALTLRSLCPAATAQRLGSSCACPVELGQLLTVLGTLHRPLLVFRIPPDALGSASAGLLRAARQRQSSVGILLDGTELPARALPGILAALTAACDEARFDLPLAILVTVPPGEAAEPLQRVHELLEAGFPSLLLSADGLDAGGLTALSAPARERELGWALEASAIAEPALAPLVRELAKLGAGAAAVRRQGWDLGHPPRLPCPSWLCSQGREPPSQRAPAVAAGVGVVEIALHLPSEARGDRAEALAYFEADAALCAWDVEETGPRAAAALLERWRA